MICWLTHDGFLQSNMSLAKHANRQTPSSRRRTVYSSCLASHAVRDDPSMPSRAVTKPRSARGVRTKLVKSGRGSDIRHMHAHLVVIGCVDDKGRGLGWDHDTRRMTELTASYCISLRIHVRFNTCMFTYACIKIGSPSEETASEG